MPGPPRTVSSAEKRKKRALSAKIRRSRTINIGYVIDEWNELKDSEGCRTDEDMAKMLVDSYKKKNLKKKKMSTSTPGVPFQDVPHMSGVSSVSSVHSSVDVGMMSGVEKLSNTSESDMEICSASEEDVNLTCKHSEEKHASITVEEIDMSYVDAGGIYDPDDETYVPSKWEISFDVSDHQQRREILDEIDGVTEEVHDIDFQDDDESSAPSTFDQPQVADRDTGEEMYIVSKSCLLQLAEATPLTTCFKCGEPLTVDMKRNGSSVILEWICINKHRSMKWASQPLLPYGVLLGNLKLNAAITVSGNSFAKIALLFKFMNIGMPSTTSFSRTQSHFVVPTVEKFWLKVKETAQEYLRASDVVVAGDGRMDSPGHSAKYCTYTVMEQRTKQIIAMEIVDKREVQLKSSVMEAAGFRRAIVELQHAGVNVVECVTDAHPQIAAIMRKEFPEIRHSWDMWHGAKNFGKKICGVAMERGKKALKPWISDITNHFYYSAENCKGDEMLMKTKLVSIMNHCSNRHEWALGQCDHEPIPEDEDRGDKQWLDPCGPEMLGLEKVVMDTRFLGTLKYYTTCQTTSELESFNNHLLMYASKRQAYSYSVYKCRCQLAAIDYMMHLDRPYRKNKDGKQCYSRTFSKAANRYSAKPLKEKKQYLYIKLLMSDIVDAYCSGDTALSHPVPVVKDDPKLIAKTIAPIPGPSTEEIVLQQKSRLKGKWTIPGTSEEM